MEMNPQVDVYFNSGCGRCSLGGTPECKVHNWTVELETLRTYILECGLREELKWSHPVYTDNDKNVCMIGAFNDNCVISFFKGSLLKDERGILTLPGENSYAGRVIRFTDAKKIVELEDVIKSFINEAVAIERSGAKVVKKDLSEIELPDELEAKMDADPEFKAAFRALTPGRQRGYIFYFSQPKQSKTREARIEKSTPKIFMGKGIHD